MISMKEMIGGFGLKGCH